MKEEQDNWLKTHKLGKGQTKNSTMDFATLLFSSWDDEQNGCLKIKDI